MNTASSTATKTTKGFFITGTDTGAGKTLVSTAIMYGMRQQGRQVSGFKPVASGCEPGNDGLRNEDALAIQAQCSQTPPYELVNPYAFEPAIAPHIAAAQAGVHICLETLYKVFVQVSLDSDICIVEGAGGWLVPINHEKTLADLATALQLPVILVVSMKLGCLNHALLSVQSIEAGGLKLAGWVANRVSGDMQAERENISSLCTRIAAPCLGEIPALKNTSVQEVAKHLNLDLLSG